jgi:DNA anti-recombination protein RmuC
MRRALWAVALAALMGAPGAWAQDVGGEDDPVRNQALRQQIEDRFAERIKAEIGLTDQQLARLRATSTTYGSRRRDLAAQERTLRGALADQMRPGVAANQDSVSKLTDGLVNLRASYAQTLRDENREMAQYLTPVQRSQVLAMRERLTQRIRAIREQRQGRREMMQEMRERREQRRRQPGP